MNISIHPYEATRRQCVRGCRAMSFFKSAEVGIILGLLLAGLASAQETEAKKPDAPNLVQLSVAGSSVIKAPWPVKQVSVANPAVADVQVVTPDQVLLVGKTVGVTDLILWSDEGQIWRGRITVGIDLSQLSEQMIKLFPGSQLQFSQSQEVLVVKGALRRADHVKQLDKFLVTSGLKHVNMTNLAGVHQVMIKVRIAEATREAVRALGINALTSNDEFFGGSTIGGNANSIDIGVPAGAAAGSNVPFTFNSPSSVSSTLTLFGGFPGSDLQFFVEALAENRYLRILSEPTLVALSGEEASFLAGGEFPIPIIQGASTGGGSSVTVEFKEFGVRLKFRPTVLGDGSIRIAVAPEVSDISDIGSVQIEGFSIPSIITRKAQTTLEMKSGQTFAMAGLIDRSTSARASRVPGFGDLPVLGSLFRSVRYEKGETELVVLATVSLVEPLSGKKARPLPGQLHQVPNDWEVYIEGRIEGRQPKAISPSNSEALRSKGFDRLRGPGAWESHESASR